MRCYINYFYDLENIMIENNKMKSYPEISIELDTIINSSHDGFWICDGQGKIIKMNPASEQLNRVKAEKWIIKLPNS